MAVNCASIMNSPAITCQQYMTLPTLLKCFFERDSGGITNITPEHPTFPSIQQLRSRLAEKDFPEVERWLSCINTVPTPFSPNELHPFLQGLFCVNNCRVTNVYLTYTRVLTTASFFQALQEATNRVLKQAADESKDEEKIVPAPKPYVPDEEGAIRDTRYNEFLTKFIRLSSYNQEIKNRACIIAFALNWITQREELDCIVIIFLKMEENLKTIDSFVTLLKIFGPGTDKKPGSIPMVLMKISKMPQVDAIFHNFVKMLALCDNVEEQNVVTTTFMKMSE